MTPASSARRFVVAAGLAVLAFAACKDSTDPDTSSGLEGSYTLTAVDDDPLPVVARVGGFGYLTWLMSGELTVRTRGRVTDERLFEDRDPEDVPEREYTQSETTVYRRAGSAFYVDRIYGATTYTDSGTVGADGSIVLRVHAIYNAGPVAAPSGFKTFTYTRTD